MLGEAVSVWAGEFLQALLTGIDHSSAAIYQAKKRYPALSFKIEDIREMTEAYDVIFTSNTLVHFDHPWAVVKTMLPYVKRYLIVLVPFQNDLLPDPEHRTQFDYHSFPLQVDSARLVAFRTLNCGKSAHSP